MSEKDILIGTTQQCPCETSLLIGHGKSSELLSLASAGQSTPAPFDPSDLTDEEKKERLQTIEEMLLEIGRTGQNQHVIFDRVCDIIMVGDY